jgi:cytoskeletal protein RodZ
MTQEPIIKSYFPLEPGEKKSEQELDLKSQKQEEEDDERAFAVGMVSIICLVALVILILVWRQVSPGKKARVEGNQSTQETQVSTPEEQVEESTQPSSSSETQTVGETYTVEPGDTLFNIGKKFKINWKEIAQANNLEEPYSLRPGQKLVIPK